MSTKNLSLDKDFFGERIRLVRKEVNLSQKEFSARLGVSPGFLSEVENSLKNPGWDFLRSLAVEFGFSINWLLTGAGFMRHSGPADGEQCAALDDEYCTIPYRRQAASAGHGAFVDGPDEEPRRMAFRRYWIENILHTNRHGLFLMSARGDSMEPEIRNGDILLVDTSQTRSRTGDICVWTYGEGELQEVLVKAVVRLSDNGEDKIKLHSLNPAYEREDRVITEKNRHLFKNEGRVVWVGRTLE